MGVPVWGCGHLEPCLWLWGLSLEVASVPLWAEGRDIPKDGEDPILGVSLWTPCILGPLLSVQRGCSPVPELRVSQVLAGTWHREA